MVQITLDLLRKWAGQDNGQLPNREMALDQRSIEKIDVINKYCPRLKILRLENNLIPRIENLYRLKVRIVQETKEERDHLTDLPVNRPHLSSQPPPPPPINIKGARIPQPSNQQHHMYKKPTQMRVSQKSRPHSQLHTC